MPDHPLWLERWRQRPDDELLYVDQTLLGEGGLTLEEQMSLDARRSPPVPARAISQPCLDWAAATARAQPTLDALVDVARPAAFCLCSGWSCTACQCRLSIVMAYEEFLWGSTRTWLGEGGLTLEEQMSLDARRSPPVPARAISQPCLDQEGLEH